MSSRINDPAFLISRWPLQGARGVIVPDEMGRWPGTAANMTGWPASGPHNALTCAELNGNNSNINCGDITQLNVLSAFTLCGWLAQGVIDQTDLIFWKSADATHVIALYTDAVSGNMFLWIKNGGDTYGSFDYSTVISAGVWHHAAMVFDGSQTGNANRLLCYVDGTPITLGFTGTIPATTADLSGANASISRSTLAFDGRLQGWRLYNIPLTRNEIDKIINTPAPSR